MIKAIELTSGRHTEIPDAANWSNLHVNKAGTHKVGDYKGSSNDVTIIDYVGNWPADNSNQRYETELDTNEFLWLLTGAEIRAIEAAAVTDDDVYKIWHVTTNTNNGIRMDSPAMQLAIGALLAKGLLTQSRYDELILGKPL